MADFSGLGFHSTLKIPILPTTGDFIDIPGLKIGGAAITSSVSELNILDGVTSTTTELNLLDGVTASTAELNHLDGSSANLATFALPASTTISSFGASLVDDANASAARTTLGLAIGSDVQAYDADLDNLSGMQSGASAALALLTSTEIAILDGATVSTAELNILDGVTSSTAELNILDGVTSSTAELNILDGVTSSTAELNILDGVTADASEINVLDGAASANSSAGKAAIVGTSGDFKVARNLTVAGNVTVNGTTTTVNSTTVTIDDPIFTLGGDTAPGAADGKDRGIELNYHDGSAAKVGFFGMDDTNKRFTFIADATNSSEAFSGTPGDARFNAVYLNAGGIHLAGVQVTATAAELNILDGVTSTAAELNILDGVTSTATELNILDGVTATTAEINRLDITTLGSSEASKVVTADGSGNVQLIAGDTEIGDGSTGRNLTIKQQSAIAFDSVSFAAGDGSSPSVLITRLLAITAQNTVSHASSASGSSAFNVVGVAMEDGPSVASAAAKSASFLVGHPQSVEFDSSDKPSSSSDNGKTVYLGTDGKAVLTAPTASGTKVVQIGFVLNHSALSGDVFSVLFQPQFITANA